jgi:hypothetical protein
MPDEGLLGIGEYTGRESAPISQVAQSTITTAPESAPAPVAAQPPPTEAAPAPSHPPQAEPEKSDLIGDLSKAFAKTIGEVPAAQPPAPERKPEEKTWKDAEPPSTVTKRVAEDWRTFREKAKADLEFSQSRIKALEFELEESKKKTPAHESQLAEARKQAQDAMGIIERVAIERSPLFKSKVLDQESLLKARLGQLLDGTGIHPSVAEQILQGDLGTRERAIESQAISAFRRQQIADTLSRWDNVQEDRAKMLDRGKETLQAYVREQQQTQESARAQWLKDAERIFEEQMTLAVPKLEVYNHIEGNDKWNQCCDSLKTVAKRIYSGNVPREMIAQAAILAPAAVAYQNLLRAAYGQIEELRGTVAKLRGVQPEVRDTGGDITQPGQALSSPNGDFVKNLVERFRKDTGLQ